MVLTLKVLRFETALSRYVKTTPVFVVKMQLFSFHDLFVVKQVSKYRPQFS